MTPPRHQIPGSSYLITRRCSERRFFLRPDSFVTRALLFVLGYALHVFGVKCHGAVALSNHWHLVVTDVKGNLSSFLRTTHSLIGKSVDAFRGRREAMWAPGRPNCIRLMTPDDILEAMVYCATNPVKDGLVSTAADWPGLVTLPKHLLGHTFSTERPGRFFSKRGALGERNSFQITRPPGFESLSDEELVARFSALVAARERELTEARRGKPVLGAKAVLKQRWNSKPKTRERWFQREPHFKCSDTELRCRVLTAYKQFIANYTSARKLFERGVRGTTFPAGTLLLRLRFGVRCRDPDPGCVLDKS